MKLINEFQLIFLKINFYTFLVSRIKKQTLQGKKVLQYVNIFYILLDIIIHNIIIIYT